MEGVLGRQLIRAFEIQTGGAWADVRAPPGGLSLGSERQEVVVHISLDCRGHGNLQVGDAAS